MFNSRLIIAAFLTVAASAQFPVGGATGGGGGSSASGLPTYSVLCQAGAAGSGVSFATGSVDPPAVCVSGLSNRSIGVWQFSSGKYIEGSFEITSVPASIVLWARRNGTGSSATATMQYVCLATDADPDTAYYASPPTLTMTDGTVANRQVKTSYTWTVNVACTAGKRLFWRLTGGATAFELFSVAFR